MAFWERKRPEKKTVHRPAWKKRALEAERLNYDLTVRMNDVTKERDYLRAQFFALKVRATEAPVVYDDQVVETPAGAELPWPSDEAIP